MMSRRVGEAIWSDSYTGSPYRERLFGLGERLRGSDSSCCRSQLARSSKA
jgi:hypothetical protein